MLKLTLYQVDAFSKQVFGGNPAAVVPLESWIYDATMQRIAAENNLSETAFIVPNAGEWEIRWFTPAQEVELCGHATLGSAYVVLTHLQPRREVVRFSSKSGELSVARDGDRLSMQLPRWMPEPVASPPSLAQILGKPPVEVLAHGSKYLCIYDSATDVAALRPDFALMRTLDRYGVCVTAPGAERECDFVSRFFAPGAGVDEDPVTGSTHCMLVPYWSKALGRTSLYAKQLSPRGGELWCTNAKDHVTLAGYVSAYLVGEIEV
ncbi:MAG TPA: PhzF family phenazine biosynthesis protein [Polyangia bacterium]|jgi:PhzF family phenazine biosynthesis protein